MFASVSQCAEPISQHCQLKVKVTGQGHGFEPWIPCPLHISYTPLEGFSLMFGHMFASVRRFRVRSVSPNRVEGFSLNFGQMFTLVRRCAESINQPCRLKVKFKGMGLSLEFRVRSVSPIPLGGFSLNFGQMFTCGTMCRTHNSAMGTQGQGHSSRSRVWALNFVSTWYLLYPWKDFSLML